MKHVKTSGKVIMGVIMEICSSIVLSAKHKTKTKVCLLLNIGSNPIDCKRKFINDVTQPGGRWGNQFCETRYK